MHEWCSMVHVPISCMYSVDLGSPIASLSNPVMPNNFLPTEPLTGTRALQLLHSAFVV